MPETSHDSKMPYQGQQLITACALIWHDFDGVIKILLTRRPDDAEFLPGAYELPGGHIDFGENMLKGLKREIKEELAVDVRVGDPFAVFDYVNATKGAHAIEVVYFATLLGSPDNITLDPVEISASLWIGKNELHKIEETGKDDPEIGILKKAFFLLEGNLPDLAISQ